MKLILRVFKSLALASVIALPLGLSAEAADKKVPESSAEVELSYAPLVKKTAPAVVNVYARRVVQENYRSPFAGDPFFERFFGGQGLGVPRERVQNSLGSGVIVKEDGIVVTNNHVIANGDEFKVVLSDRREFDAEVILQDERADLAILRIDTDGEKLPVLRFHDSDEAEVGDLVLAIGNPFGVGQTVTSGIISALARTHVGVSDFQFFIQTDAAINPGNSGGALVTMDGELVGVNTAIFSRSGGSNGIGFAIPANMVKLVVEQAISGGTIRRPWLGASGQVVTSDIAQSLDFDRPAGVLINQLHPHGPADEAGLEVGDVILLIGGFDVHDLQSLRYRIATQQVGETIEVTYFRDGRSKVAKVHLAPPPDDPPAKETQLTGRHPLSGAKAANMSPAFNEENGLDTMMRGVVITGVSNRTSAARFGIQPGDVVVAINGVEVTDIDRLNELVEENVRTWNIRLRRNGRDVQFTVRS